MKALLVLMTFLFINQSFAATYCQDVKTASFYSEGKANFYNIHFDYFMNVVEGPVTGFTVSDQDGNPAPEVQESFKINFDKVMFFYDQTDHYPASRGGVSTTTLVKFYAISATATSSTTNIGRIDQGDYLSPSKEVTLLFLCETHDYSQREEN